MENETFTPQTVQLQEVAPPTQDIRPEQAQVPEQEDDDYLLLKKGGYSDEEIQDYFRPILQEAGYTDQDINAYFLQYTRPEKTGAEVIKRTLSDYFANGWDSSVLGLAINGKLPEGITPGDLEKADWLDTLAYSVGQFAGDLPTYVMGGAAGLATGPNAVVASPALAMATTEGMRAYYMERIKAGHTEDYDILQGAAHVLGEAGKGGLVGGAAGGAGALARAGLTAAGAGVGTKLVGSLGAEAATMVGASSALEGRLPEPKEFVNAGMFMMLMHAAPTLVKQTPKIIQGSKELAQTITEKAREIYVRTGKGPEELVHAAEENPTVIEDLASINRDVPEVLMRDTAGGEPRREQPTQSEQAQPAQPTEGTQQPAKPPQAKTDSLYAQGAQSPTEIQYPPNKDVMPQGEVRHEEAVKLSDIITDLEKIIETPIRLGKLGNVARSVLGLFKPHAEVIRLREANDIPTAFHEAGHSLQKKLYGTINDTPLKPFESELQAIATTPGAGQSPLPEGFAEFVAKYVVDPQSAQQLAPNFYTHFESLMQQKAPQILDALNSARENVRRFAEQPALMEVLGHVSFDGKPAGEGFFSRLFQRETWDSLYTGIFDRMYPLKRITEKISGGEEIPVDMDPYILARTFLGAKGKATHFLEHSPFRYQTYDNVGKSLKSILEPVKNLDELTGYLTARRGRELDDRGIKTGIRREAMDAVYDELNQKYEGIAKEIDEYQDHLVQYLVDSGVMSEKAAHQMRDLNKAYVPFHRVMEDAQGFLGSGGNNFRSSNPVKRIKGSTRDIINPLESIIKNTYALIEAAEKNAVGKALVDLTKRYEGAGWAIEEIPLPKEAVSIDITTAAKGVFGHLTELDPQYAQMIQDLVKSNHADELLTFFRNSTRIDTKREIMVFQDGQKHLYQVAPEIAEVINGLNKENVPAFIRLLAIPTGWLRAGITLSFDFMGRNIFRDAVSSGVISRSGFTPFVDTARGIKEAVQKNDDYWNWMKAGGDQSSLVTQDRTTLKKSLDDLTRSGYFEGVRNVIKNPMEFLRVLSDYSEKMTRLGEYKKAIAKEGRSDKSAMIKAAFEARDLIDFMRKGKYTSSFSAALPFFNASIQGLDRTARGVIENPRQFLVRSILYVGLPSIALAVYNHNDPDIEEIPEATRDLFWCVKIPLLSANTLNKLGFDLSTDEKEKKAGLLARSKTDSVIIRIPKPFEIGIGIGSLLERTTEFVLSAAENKYGSIEKARKKSYNKFLDSIVDLVMPSYVPTAATPILENYANRSLAFNGRIVPASREGLLPELQASEQTTELMKALSRAIGRMPGLTEMDTFSPAKAENLIRGWTGTLGKYALQLTDFIARKTGLVPDPVKPEDTLADTIFIKAFIVRHPSLNSKSIEDFYDGYDRASRYLKSIGVVKKEFKYEEVQHFMPYSIYQSITGTKEALSNISHVIHVINDAPNLTSAQKRQEIDKLYIQMLQVARVGNQALEIVEEKIAEMKKNGFIK